MELFFEMIILLQLSSSSNHMFGRTIWDKLPGCISEKFEIAWVKSEDNFKVFKNSKGDLSQKITLTKHVITG